MADQEITKLAALPAADADDLLVIVDDPSGGASTKKIVASAINKNFIRTTAEITAGKTPVSFQYPSGHVFRWMTTAEISDVEADTASLDVGVAIQTASDSGHGRVFMPDGTYLFATGITPPNRVHVIGETKRGTVLKYSGSGIAIKFGTSDSVLNVGCSLRHCSVKPTDKAAKAVVLNATNGALIDDVYIEGLATPFDNTRTSVGITIDGRNISSFFNTIKDVNCVHLHIGYELGTTGTTQATTTNFINCQAFCDVATDNSGVGIKIGDSGDGAVWQGGNVEQCATGIQLTVDARPMTFMGLRFESNTVDILTDAGAKTSNFIGLLDFLLTKVTENSVNKQQFIGCNQSTLVPYSLILNLLSKKLIENVTGTNVITPDESGKTFFLNSSGGFTSTLPAAADGLHYTFIVRAAPSSGDYVITTDGGANVMGGAFLDIVGELTPFTSQDTLNFISGKAGGSDRLEVECDGITWHCWAFSKADGGITVSVT